jgi:4-amino-4-deoxy-L-arabinose transferase-like glycosyltransferase
VTRSGRGAVAIAGCCLLVWIALALSLAATRIPWSNEAWCALPAVNLLAHGNMGTPILAGKGTWLQGLDRHTYWIMPLHSLVQAVWYKLTGFSLLHQRWLSILFGVLALISWFQIVWRLTSSYLAALICLLIVGFERNFLNAAANGRMDMMAAALGASALAVWLAFHSRSPRLATLAGHSLAAAAIFTHPCGVLFTACLLFITLSSQRWRISIATLGLASIPYVAALALWGVYIAQAPSDFASQFFGNMSGFAGEYQQRTRFSGLAAPWRAVAQEIQYRYLAPFGFAAWRTVPGLLNALWLIISVSAIAIALASRRIRELPAVRWMLGSAALVFMIMALFEGMKFQHYLVYSLPFLGAVTAITGTALSRLRMAPNIILLGALSLLIVPQTAGVIRHFRNNPYRAAFLPVADRMRNTLQPGEHVIAGAEFGYVLGFTDALSDDVRLGYYTGVEPRYIVTEGWYRDWFANAINREPAVASHIRNFLDRGYRISMETGEFVLYERNPQ